MITSRDETWDHKLTTSSRKTYLTLTSNINFDIWQTFDFCCVCR